MIKKEIKFSSGKFRRAQLQSQIWRKGFLIYKEKRKYLIIFEEAFSEIWLFNCILLNFLIYEENFIFFFLSVQISQDPLKGNVSPRSSQGHKKVKPKTSVAVLRIHDILGWIRIRILGSMPLTNGSGSCYIRHWPSRCQQKTNFWTQFFCLLLFEATFISFFKDKKSKRVTKY